MMGQEIRWLMKSGWEWPRLVHHASRLSSEHGYGAEGDVRDKAGPLYDSNVPCEGDAVSTRQCGGEDMLEGHGLLIGHNLRGLVGKPRRGPGGGLGSEDRAGRRRKSDSTPEVLANELDQAVFQLHWLWGTRTRRFTSLQLNFFIGKREPYRANMSDGYLGTKSAPNAGAVGSSPQSLQTAPRSLHTCQGGSQGQVHGPGLLSP